MSTSRLSDNPVESCSTFKMQTTMYTRDVLLHCTVYLVYECGSAFFGGVGGVGKEEAMQQ